MSTRDLAFLLLLSLIPAGCADAPRATGGHRNLAAQESHWSFAVISDVHVNTHDVVAPEFTRLVKKLAELRRNDPDSLRFVVIDGDSTCGNPGDRFTAARADRWWRSFKRALWPLRALGVPLLPVAGNHDFYTPAQREAYARAWGTPSDYAGELRLSGHPPLYYSTDVDGVHLALLHVITQSISPNEAEWLSADLATAGAGRLKLAFGHVPLISVMAKKVMPFEVAFKNAVGGILAEKGVAAYIAGHEHLVWDEALTIAGRPLRQVIVGTASATYTFPLSPRVRRAHCTDDQCRMPYPSPGEGTAFTLEHGSGQQRHHQALTFIEVRGDAFEVRPLAVTEAGELVPFEKP